MTSLALLVIFGAVLPGADAASRLRISRDASREDVSPLVELHARVVAETTTTTVTATTVWPGEEHANAGSTTVITTTTTTVTTTGTPLPTSSIAGWTAFNPILPTTTVAPLAGVQGFGNVLGTNTSLQDPAGNVSQPCYQMNQSAVVNQLQNAARLSADAAQASMNAVSQAGAQPSSVASVAYATANEAAAIWEKLLHTAIRTEQETLTASGQLHTMKKISEKAASDYEKSIMKVRDFPPHIPAVKKEQALQGISRT